MWPYKDQEQLGESYSVAVFLRKIGIVNGELVMQLGSDGEMRLSLPDAPDVVLATINLVAGRPWIEQLRSYPRIIKPDVVATWEESNGCVDPDDLSCVKGPAVLTAIEPGKTIDVYTDAPPWEKGATPTRSLTDRDIAGGWFIDHMQQAFANRRVTVSVRRPSRAALFELV